MMNKAIFLDRDGTINVDKHYLYKIEDFEFLPRVVDGLRMLQDAGYLLIVVTNQSGIARGFYTEDDFWNLNNHMIELLASERVQIADILYCPHLPDAKIEKYRVDCNCRKPKLGMYFEAVKKWNIDLSQSWAIGDRERDCAICMTTGCRGIVIKNQENIYETEQMYFRTVKSMKEAVEIILKTKSVDEYE